MLEFLEPSWGQNLVLPIGTSARTGEEMRLLLDHGVGERESLFLVIPGPVG